jgi:hypothetical protein
MRDFHEIIVESSYLLAEMGVLGGGNGGNDIYSGPSTAAEAMALAEEFMDSSSGGGKSRNPRVFYPEVFNRLVNTDMSTLSFDDQVAISKGALMAALESSMVREVLRSFEAQLDRMGFNYLDEFVTGAIGLNVSYPEYLEQHGMRDWIEPGLTPTEIAEALRRIPQDESFHFLDGQIGGEGMIGDEMHAFP